MQETSKTAFKILAKILTTIVLNLVKSCRASYQDYYKILTRLAQILTRSGNSQVSGNWEIFELKMVDKLCCFRCSARNQMTWTWRRGWRFRWCRDFGRSTRWCSRWRRSWRSRSCLWWVTRTRLTQEGVWTCSGDAWWTPTPSTTHQGSTEDDVTRLMASSRNQPICYITPVISHRLTQLLLIVNPLPVSVQSTEVYSAFRCFNTSKQIDHFWFEAFCSHLQFAPLSLRCVFPGTKAVNHQFLNSRQLNWAWIQKMVDFGPF